MGQQKEGVQQEKVGEDRREGQQKKGVQQMCRGSVMNGWGVERGDGSHLSQLSQVGGS